ncbi:HVA22-like protein e [Hibiscus syriacus]|uniref:HVA22-like protein e n=1 Tax=Hibiscus syriacus TaxID=106335 RepID=UPI001920ED51|nr:HVA22-like protein e [Hibiscus syriacus]
MSRFWTLLTALHSLAGPLVMLLYPLYASIMAIESPNREDNEQWLAYWILYSLLTITEMVFESVLEWIPIWCWVKLLFMSWLVLPHLRGASFIYERLAREQMIKYGILRRHSPDGKGK